jgi:hypothetical protein
VTKKFIWLGFFVGSTIGNMLPTIWGGSVMSISGFVLAILGGIGGMWVGYRWGQSVDS